MVTYQVSLEVDEDSGCHLGDEDEEETGEVLQTEDRKGHLQLLDTQTKARTFEHFLASFSQAFDILVIRFQINTSICFLDE